MVSIIVPIYNTEKYLDECLRSIVSQTFKDWELILVDDGSTDSSGKIAEDYARKDNRIKVLHINNGGLSWARNHGIDIAVGEYITFVDADDELSDGALQSLYEAIIKYDADIVQGKFTYEKGKTAKGGKIKNFEPEEAIENVLLQRELVSSAWGKLYRKELFEGLRYRVGLYYEDLDLFYKLFEKCKRIVFIPETVYFYRQTPGSILHIWNGRRLHVLQVTKDIEHYIQRHYPTLLAAARDRRLSANFNIFALASKNGETDVANECWDIIKSYRRDSLINLKVRLKNKAGILISYFGKRFFTLVSRIIY